MASVGSVTLTSSTFSGNSADCRAIGQHGWPRPQDGTGDGIATCDVGSYELSIQRHSLYRPLIRRG